MKQKNFNLDIKGILAKRSVKKGMENTNLKGKMSPVEKILGLVQKGYLRKVK